MPATYLLFWSKYTTRSLGNLRSPTSNFRPALVPSGLLDFVLRHSGAAVVKMYFRSWSLSIYHSVLADHWRHLSANQPAAQVSLKNMTSPSTFDTFFTAVHPEHISFSGWTVLLGLVTTFHFASRTVFRKRNTNPSHLEQPRVSQKCFHLFHKKYSEKTHSKEFINLFLFSSTEGILSYFSSPPSYINYPSF